MVNQIISSTTSQRSVDSTPLTKVATNGPVAAIVKVAEKLSDQKQQGTTQHQSTLLAQTSRANYQLAQTQTSIQALTEASGLLSQLRNTTRRMSSVQDSKKEQQQQTLYQLKSKLMRLTKEASYAGEKLLHHDLTPRINNEALVEQFSIKGLQFNQFREQNEILRFQFEEGQPSTIRVKIEPHQSIDEVVTVFNKAFSKRSISVNMDRFGEIQFSINKDAWPATKKGVWMSGAGQILPSGNPVKAKLENHEKNQVELELLDFGKPELARNAIGVIDHLMKNIAQSIDQLDKQQHNLGEQLDQIFQRISQQSMIQTNGSRPSTPHNVAVHLIDNAVPTLLAQANATRHNVVALLEPVI